MRVEAIRFYKLMRKQQLTADARQTQEAKELA
jgi:hypothetical protein